MSAAKFVEAVDLVVRCTQRAWKLQESAFAAEADIDLDAARRQLLDAHADAIREAVEKERERCAKVAASWDNGGALHNLIAAAIREGK